MNSTNPTISIIIPVYNTEKYLRRCLDSIMEQTYKDFECILVDDGSTDGSGKICDEYASKDERFKVIHKENCGVATARQAGTNVATGEYIIHADPDDWTEPQMLEQLYRKAKETNADIIICDYYDNLNGKDILKTQRPLSLCPAEIIKEILGEHKLYGALWNKFIKRECFTRYKIEFKPKIDICEDMLVCVQLLLHSEVKVAYLNKAFYHYYVDNTQSLLHEDIAKHIAPMNLFLNRLEEILPENYRYLAKCERIIFEFNLWCSHLITKEEFQKINVSTKFIKENVHLRKKGKLVCILLNLGHGKLARLILNIKKPWNYFC